MSALAVSFKNISGLVRSDRPLTNDQILEAAPSVFAASPHDSRSSRYAYIPTSDIVNGLRGEGFQPFFVCQAKSRIEGKTEFTKHMIRFRYASQILSCNGLQSKTDEPAISAIFDQNYLQLTSSQTRIICN